MKLIDVISFEFLFPRTSPAGNSLGKHPHLDYFINIVVRQKISGRQIRRPAVIFKVIFFLFLKQIFEAEETGV